MKLRFVFSTMAAAGTLALLSPAAQAQKTSPTPHRTTHSPARKVSSSVPLVMTPIDSAGGDSIAAIVSRDLEMTDRIHIVPRDSLAPKAATLQGKMSRTGVSFSLIDPVTSAVRQQRDFALPGVPAARDSAITDSLTRLLAGRDTVRYTERSRIAAVRDSISREAAKPKPKLRGKTAEHAYALMLARRDTILRAGAARDSVLLAEGTADIAARDSMVKVLVAADAHARDSAIAARRWVIHNIADGIAEWLTGARGIASTRIAYVAHGVVHIVDFDGEHDHIVTSGPPAMSPSWHPSANRLAYTDLTDAGTAVYWVDLATGVVHPVNVTHRGLNITPVYTPDGKTLVFATADPSKPALIGIDADSAREIRHVGGGRKFEVDEPTFSPDGARVAYVSSRPSVPQIFSSKLDGTDERAELPKPVSYSTAPDWSPDGRYIAFQEQHHLFQIYTVDRTNRKVVKLTTTGENEDPTWAPDSRHLAITSNRAGDKSIWIMDVPSGRVRQLTKGDSDRLPAWSRWIPAQPPAQPAAK